MGRRWRIRHKLTLGLVLAAGIILLLLAGTLYGMLSYRGSMKAIRSKLYEWSEANSMEEAVKNMSADRSGPYRPLPNQQQLLGQVAVVKAACERYRKCLDNTVSNGWDPDDGKKEYDRLESIEKHIGELKSLASKDPEVSFSVTSNQLTDWDLKIGKLVASLRGEIHDIPPEISSDIDRVRGIAKGDDYYTMALVIGASALGFLLLLILAVQAYRWLVGPIRELHEKVIRLAQGNFDSRIVVQSNDEIQDLAEAFNNMTERLQTIYRDLEHQVNERSRQLVRSESLAGVGFLAAGVAHEINNPLASIAFCGEALERRLRELLAGKRDHPDMVTVNNYLRMIQDEAFRCKDITQKLLEFSRIGERQRQMTDLAQVIQSVIDMVHLHQAYKGKHIVFDPIRNPTLLVNDQEIKSVVLNLVANALDSMDEGGTLTITLDAAGGMAVMTFTDTGCGMAPEVLENLFEPFFSRSRTGKGIGLGLSISHRIITEHGGEIEATSPGPNQGSTFTVRLPLTPAAAAEQPAMAMAA